MVKLMEMYYKRFLEASVLDSIRDNPVTVITGPRQCGKSTMARKIMQDIPGSLYVDLQKPADLAKLNDPQYFFETFRGKLICLDEIQRLPGLFPVIRSLVDEWGGNGHFLFLGSASRDLLRQSSESLAGRISFKELTPFLLSEISMDGQPEMYMTRGGFPRSMMARTDGTSFSWRQDFIAAFLERDLLQWSGFSTATMRRLWQMLAHVNGQTVNYSSLGNALGVSSPTIRNYIDLLASTYMVVPVLADLANLGKRLVRSPKIYLSDPGIVNALLDIQSFRQLLGHPSFGTIWETVIISQLRGHFPEAGISFYRTSQGAEVDFVWVSGGITIAIECKASVAPSLTRGNHEAIADIKPAETLVVCPVRQGWPLKPGIRVVNPAEMVEYLRGKRRGS